MAVAVKRMCRDMAYSSTGVPSNQNRPPRYEPQPRLDFSANLDIVRGIAVLLVLLDHVLDVVASKHPLRGSHDYIGCSGRLGVLLFFVHTSLVLNFSLARLGTSGWELFRTFLVRRAFRLYPLSSVCILLVVLFGVPPTPLGHGAVSHSGDALFSNLALTTDLTDSVVFLGPLWTLPAELQMYVAMPILFMLLGRARSPWIALGLWLLAACVAWMQPEVVRRLSSIDFAPCFIAGIVAYTLSGRYARRIPGLLWMPVLLAMLSVFFIVQEAAPYGYTNMPLEWVFCLALGLIIPLFQGSPLATVNYMAHRLSRYSYGIYLFHAIALWVGCNVLGDWPEPMQWIVALALLSVLSVGSYHLLEKPAIDFGVRLTQMAQRFTPSNSRHLT